MATMEHNVVVLMSADDIMAIGQGGASAPDNDYIPADMADKIIAHTSMSAPGETVSISFDAPLVPGEYPFICTFPGHFMTMKGVMRVVA
jgi:azurin